MTERGDQSKEGRGGTCPLTGPVKPRDGAWWRGSAQVQRGGGCSLSGGVGISVRPVVGHTGLWMRKGQVCLFVTRAVQCCKCVCEGRAMERRHYSSLGGKMAASLMLLYVITNVAIVFLWPVLPGYHSLQIHQPALSESQQPTSPRE